MSACRGYSSRVADTNVFTNARMIPAEENSTLKASFLRCKPALSHSFGNCFSRRVKIKVSAVGTVVCLVVTPVIKCFFAFLHILFLCFCSVCVSVCPLIIRERVRRLSPNFHRSSRVPRRWLKAQKLWVMGWG